MFIGQVLSPEYVLFAGGRQGNIENLGLEEAGVDITGSGYVAVDEYFQTTARAIYAAGDVTGPPGLASVAAEQGRVAASHAFGLGVRDQVDSLPAYGVYAIPEAAMVGMTEEQVRLQGVDYEVGRGAFDANPRAVIAGGTEVMIKLVFRRSDKVLLGVHILGDIACELIHLGQAVVRQHLPVDYFIETTFNVPTFTDSYKTAAYDGLIRLDRRSKV
jgi:NAD(P) transhydrogenase